MKQEKIYSWSNGLGNFKLVSDWIEIQCLKEAGSNDYRPFIKLNEDVYYLDNFLRFNVSWTDQLPTLTSNDNDDVIILSGKYVYNGDLFVEISDCSGYVRLFERI